MDQRANFRRKSPAFDRRGSQQDGRDDRFRPDQRGGYPVVRSRPDDSRADWQRRQVRHDTPPFVKGSRLPRTDYVSAKYDSRDHHSRPSDRRPSDHRAYNGRLNDHQPNDHRRNGRQNDTISSHRPSEAETSISKSSGESTKQSARNAERPDSSSTSRNQDQAVFLTISRTQKETNTNDVTEKSKEETVEKKKKTTHIFSNMPPVTTLDDETLDYGDSEDDIDPGVTTSTDSPQLLPTRSATAENAKNNSTGDLKLSTNKPSSEETVADLQKEDLTKNEQERRESISLPWREIWSSKGELYYYNEETGKSQWDLPETPEEDTPKSNSKSISNSRRNSKERDTRTASDSRNAVEPRQQTSSSQTRYLARNEFADEHSRTKRARLSDDVRSAQLPPSFQDRVEPVQTTQRATLSSPVRASVDRYSEEQTLKTQHNDGYLDSSRSQTTRYPSDNRQNWGRMERRDNTFSSDNGYRRDYRNQNRRGDMPRRRPY